MKNEVNLIFATTEAEAIAARDNGYEPVECPFGPVSVVGKFFLDHHGPYSQNEAVSIRAARLVLEEDVFLRNFVVTGSADCDQSYAISVLSRNIPARLDEATAVAELDVDPVGRDKTAPRYIRCLMFEQRTRGLPDCLDSSRTSLENLITIFNGEYTETDVALAIQHEEKRKTEAMAEIRAKSNGIIALVESADRSFDVWYQVAPVVVQRNPIRNKLTLMLCPKRGGILPEKSGLDLLGPEGLTPFYKEIDNVLGVTGSGGRDVVGGSPQGIAISYEQAERVYEFLKSRITI